MTLGPGNKLSHTFVSKNSEGTSNSVAAGDILQGTTVQSQPTRCNIAMTAERKEEYNGPQHLRSSILLAT